MDPTINPVDGAPVAEPVFTPVDQSLGRDDFLKLLVTQLQQQNPLDPVDNTAFIAELAQFNSLDELIQIREASEATALLLAGLGLPETSNP
ncbi:MAG: flagellar hook assembly protein FlgD [Acidobacteriota bacterium]